MDLDRTAHVLLTRFAVRLAPLDPVPSPAWIAERCRLFETYCLPSVKAQSGTNFVWLLLVDPQIDAESRSRLEAYSGQMSAIKVADYVSGSYESLVRAVTSDTAAAIITTRIDNDDAVSRDHISRVRAAAAAVPEGERKAFVFTSGYELSEGRLYWRPFPRSPFSSLIEPSTSPLSTIMAAGHEQIDELAPVVELGSPAAWLQVVHGGNVLNRVRGVRVPRNRLRGAFSVADDSLYQPEPVLSLALGIPGSYLRLAADLARNPRYRAKVRALLAGRRS